MHRHVLPSSFHAVLLPQQHDERSECEQFMTKMSLQAPTPYFNQGKIIPMDAKDAINYCQKGGPIDPLYIPAYFR